MQGNSLIKTFAILFGIVSIYQLSFTFISSTLENKARNAAIDKISEDQRRKAKAINFGIIYGITQYGLAKQISVSNEEAQEFINSYFKKFPEIKDYMQTTVKNCRKQGYVSNIFGRRIHLRGINDKNFSVRSFQERAAINAPIQGSAADIIKIAMINIDKEIEKRNLSSKMLLQVHDELIFDMHKSEASELKLLVRTKMEEAVKLNVPLIVDIGEGSNWLEAH